MLNFTEIEKRALARKGPQGLADHLGHSTSYTMAGDGDDRWLAAMSFCVFSAGFRWNVIKAKWDGFEDAFFGFDPPTVAAFDAGIAEGLRHDKRIVRNPRNIQATIENAAFVTAVAEEHGSFDTFVRAWPDDDVIGLWAFFKKNGARLGGDTGPRTLRMMGKDTFVLTGDVTRALTEMGVMTASATSKTGQRQAQAAFNAWAAESGRPLAEISITLACTVDRSA